MHFLFMKLKTGFLQDRHVSYPPRPHTIYNVTMMHLHVHTLYKCILKYFSSNLFILPETLFIHFILYFLFNSHFLFADNHLLLYSFCLSYTSFNIMAALYYVALEPTKKVCILRNRLHTSQVKAATTTHHAHHHHTIIPFYMTGLLI